MRKQHPLEQDIERVLATIAAYTSQHGDSQEVSDETTEPLTTEQEQDEPIETYHIYPMQGGIYITKEEPPIDDTQVIAGIPAMRTAHPTSPPIALSIPIILSILVSLALIGFLVFVSTMPTTKQLTIIRSFTLPAHLLPPVVKRGSTTIVATGRGHQDATIAHGTIILYNGSFTEQVIPQNMIFTSSAGVQIATDQQVTIPPGNPPSYGQVSVSAHANVAGTQGNIPAYAINIICCAAAVKAVNTLSFIGGTNAREYPIVTATNISNGVRPFKKAIDQQIQAALQTHLTTDDVYIALPCSSTVRTNHHAGEEATTVTITVSETCSGVTYSQQSLQNAARQLVQIPTNFMLVSFQVHAIDTAILPNQKEVTITVAITTVLCYQQQKQLMGK